MPIMNAPKRYAVNLVCMANEAAKNVPITMSELLLDVVWKALRIRIEFFAQCDVLRYFGSGTAIRIWQNSDVEFSDHELYAELAVIVEHILHFIRARIVKPPVSLQSYSIDANSFGFQPAN